MSEGESGVFDNLQGQCLTKENTFNLRFGTEEYLKEYYPGIDSDPNTVKTIIAEAGRLRKEEGVVDVTKLTEMIPQLQGKETEVVENYLILDFTIRAMEKILEEYPGDSLAVLDSATGPTVYQLFPLSLVADTISSGEYLARNREEVQKWISNSPDAYNWDDYARLTSTMISLYKDRLQGVVDSDVYSHILTLQEPGNLISKTRNVFVKTEPIDFFSSDNNLPETYKVITWFVRNGFPKVGTAFFGPESATKSVDEWQKAVAWLSSEAVVGQDGFFLMASLNGASSYTVGGEEMPAVNLSFSEQVNFLKNQGLEIVMAEELTGSDKEKTKYEGMSFILAKRRSNEEANPVEEVFVKKDF